MKKKKRPIKKDSGTFDCLGKILSVVLLTLACISLGAIIVYVVRPMFCKDLYESLPEASINGLVLTCVTLSITLSIVVPWMMSKSQVNKAAEEAVKQYYDKDFTLTIQKTHDTLFRAYANDSRMIAYFLCQHNKPVWALGWVCKSSTTYNRIQDFNQRRTYTTLAVSNVYVLISCILQIYKKMADSTLQEVLNKDNDERKNEVAIRTARDLVKFCSTIELRDKDYASVFKDTSGEDIPETLYDALEKFLTCLLKHLRAELKDNLIDELELYDEGGENEEIYQKYFQYIEKRYLPKTQEDSESAFKEKASSLESMYTKYLDGIRTKG